MQLRPLSLVLAAIAAPACSYYDGSADPGIEVYEGTPNGSPEPIFDGEILRNGGFEHLDPTGWVREWKAMDNNPDGEIIVVTDRARFSTHAVQWKIDAAGDGREYWITQPDVPVAALQRGKSYALTGTFMVDHLGGEIAFSYGIRDTAADPDPDIGTISELGPMPSAINVWEPYAFTFTVPRNASPAGYELYLHVIKFTSEPLNLYIDGTSLHPTR
jgi:hypothetical protein